MLWCIFHWRNNYKIHKHAAMLSTYYDVMVARINSHLNPYLKTKLFFHSKHYTTTEFQHISQQNSRINRILSDIILAGPFAGRIWRFTAWLPHTFPYKCITEGAGIRVNSAIVGMKRHRQMGVVPLHLSRFCFVDIWMEME